ncbi:MAG: hypothetical protein ACLQMH_15625, partial [Solirubrobacteraceae bacterium]
MSRMLATGSAARSLGAASYRGLARLLPGPRGSLFAALLATLALTCAPAPGAAADSAGTVHFVRSADTSFNQYTSDP